MLGSRKRVEVNADASNPKVLRNLAGDTVYYGGPAVTASSYDGSLAAGQATTISQGKWLIGAGQTRVSADTIPDSDRVVELDVGNLGTAYSLSLGGQREVWLHGTLNQNCTLTLNGVTRTAMVRCFLTQDATGGRTFTVADSAGSLAISVSSTASSLSLVEMFAKPDGSVVVRS